MSKLDKYLLPIVLLIPIIFAFVSHNNQDTRQAVATVAESQKQNNNDEDYIDTYVSEEFGFSFDYDAWLVVVDDPNIELNPFLQRKDEIEKLFLAIPFPYILSTGIGGNRPFTSVAISVSENKESLSPIEWIKSPESGFDILEEGYDIWTIDGQEAVSIDDGRWVIFNSPDDKYRISISLLLDAANDAQPLDDDMAIIVESFSFKKE